jgi:uroporphyrinogen decarboxylase (EC 4.1.1.37)
MLDACLTPELASEITLQPVRRHGVDAAIFFSDIVVPVKLAGVDVRIVQGAGRCSTRPSARRRMFCGCRRSIPTLWRRSATPSHCRSRSSAVRRSSPSAEPRSPWPRT